MQEQNISTEHELEAAIDGDQAVAYFAETVKRRLDAGVVDATTYVLEMRRELDADEEKIEEAGWRGELQSDQIVEKMARIERKRTVLSILADAGLTPAREIVQKTIVTDDGKRRLTLEGAAHLLGEEL